MIETSKAVYRDFLTDVVREGVFSEEQRTRGAGRPLGDEARRAIDKGDSIDLRAPLLATLSGKGGWLPGPAFARRKPFVNVTLIDHLASVVRGALVFGEIDLRAAGVPEGELPGRLAKIAAVAFLHDADKMLRRDRRVEIEPGDVEGLMRDYGVVRFMTKFGQAPDAERMTSMIDQVETTRANRMRPGEPILSSREVQDCAYVALADRLDGAYLDTRKGIERVVEELRAFENDNLRGNALGQWRALRIVSPHTPFLLDELQGHFSHACTDRHGHPPLIEVHHDGELLLVAPSAGFDDVFDRAVDALAKAFDLDARVDISARGMPDILDGGRDAGDIREHLEENISTASKALRISVDLVNREPERSRIDDLFIPFGVAPSWPDFDRYSARLVSPWLTNREADDARDAFLVDAATVAVALACKAPRPGRKLNVPDARERERELGVLMTRSGIQVPEWLTGLKHGISRRNLLSALAAATASMNEAFREALLGNDGPVNLWLRGRGERHGLLDKIDDPGSRMAAAAQAWFRGAARGRLARADNEDAEGRCHFTNAPVPRSAPIKSSTGLYGIKVSAFSGREGRRESFDSAKAETLVSPLALAEHRLRSIRVRRSGGRPDVPVLISSPTSAGLFASLVYVRNELPLEFSLFDALRADNRKSGKIVFHEVDHFSRRYRIGRYEALPERMVSRDRDIGMVAFVKMVFETAQRIGRPIHVFRGLPRPEPGFVGFDFLPEHLVAALGGMSFRLEQIPAKIRLLRMVEEVASTAGMGLELAARVADPETRFAAACDAVMRIDRMNEGKANAKSFLRHLLLSSLEDTETMKTGSDDVIVRFAESMAHVQRARIRSDGDTVSEIGLRVALDAVEAAGQLGQTSRDSLIHATMGSLDKELGRKDLFSSSATRKDTTLHSSLLNAARIFIDDVWPKAFASAPPPSRRRRIALAIYRMSFERAARAARGANDESNEETHYDS